MEEVIRPLGGHAVFLLFVQIALLVAAARIGAELVRRLGLPAVVGELAAGIALGPSLFGHFAPHVFRQIFPATVESFHLLDVIGNLGMALLLLLTGLETDVRLLRNLGRAAVIASATGMIVPFLCGWGLGMLVPESYLVDPARRSLFALFLATAMSISAMPVIAKILADMNLTRRNIGLVILSAGVVDDTAGWLILSLIAGAASHGGADVGRLGVTLGLLAAFLVVAALVLLPVLRRMVRLVSERARSPDSDLVLVIVVTLLCAAATEWIGVHAVFGAFIAGIVFNQVPRLRAETVHRLEAFVNAILAPVFFGIVGLKVDLWAIGPDGAGMLVLVLGVATAGKLIGCTVGGLWGGLRGWEALSIAVAMNARGAMGIVLAMIGLGLGLLSTTMFSIIIVTAIVTSFMAPLGLRLTMPRVLMTEDEARRILVAESTGSFDPAKVRVLLATGGGAGALAAAPLCLALAYRSHTPLRVLHIDRRTSLIERWLARLSRTPAHADVTAHLGVLRAAAGADHAPEVRKVVSRDVAATILDEAGKGDDVVVLGATQGEGADGDIAARVVSEAPCHVVLMHASPRGVAAGAPAGAAPLPSYKHVLVPVDGGAAARVAVELAARYAEAAGARLTLALVGGEAVAAATGESGRGGAGAVAAAAGESGRGALAAAPDDAAGGAPARDATRPELERISVVFRASSLQPEILHLAHDPEAAALAALVGGGDYDLVVVGAENRSLRRGLFFGLTTQRLIEASPAPVAVVVPHLQRVGGPRGAGAGVGGIALLPWVLACGVLAASCGGSPPTAPTPTFVDVTEAAGIRCVQMAPAGCTVADGCDGLAWSTGGGAAGDYDGDGRPDLYLTRIDGAGTLLRNTGDGRFEDVTEAAGLSAVRRGNGAAWGDVDGDGDLDLAVTTHGGPRLLLFINDGAGRFVEEAEARGVALASPDGDAVAALAHFGKSAAFGDFDRDGWIDLHVTSWFVAGQGDAGPSRTRLLRNLGPAAPGHFEDVTDAAGVSVEGSYHGHVVAYASAFTDLDGDGWPDLVMAADYGTSRLFWNRGDGTFVDGTVAAGVGTEENGMGSTVGDFDGDGRLDWLVSAIDDPGCPLCPVASGGNRLYRNLGGRRFADATDAAGLRDGAWAWGVALFDYDNDGDLDAVLTNGNPEAGAAYAHDATRLWRNQGGRTKDVATAAGLVDDGEGRGLLVLDYDGDGDLDVLIARNGASPRLFRNDGGNRRDFLRVRLDGAPGNTAGLGALVTARARAGGPAQLREVGSATHFQAQSEPIAHFGLDAGTGPVSEVRVRWPATGEETVLHDVARRTTLVVHEVP